MILRDVRPGLPDDESQFHLEKWRPVGRICGELRIQLRQPLWGSTKLQFRRNRVRDMGFLCGSFTFPPWEDHCLKCLWQQPSGHRWVSAESACNQKLLAWHGSVTCVQLFYNVVDGHPTSRLRVIQSSSEDDAALEWTSTNRAWVSGIKLTSSPESWDSLSES